MPSRQKPQYEIISGIHAVREAMSAGRRRFARIYTNQARPGKRIAPIIETARRLNMEIQYLSSEELTKISGTRRHQGVAAEVSHFSALPLDRLLDRTAKPSTPPFLLILDSIEDPQNLGALVRTATCAGVDGIIIPKDRSAGPTPSVSRASAGALEHSNLSVVTNLVNATKALKKSGIWVIGLDRQGPQSIYDTDMTGPRALVVGGEDTGIRQLVRRHCDFLCHIPQTGPINSLNASVAGAIAVFEAFRQRGQKRPER